MDDVIARLLRIEGRVQGVGFRWSMYQAARNSGITGWVRNRLDGSVEALVSGSETAVLGMIAWARQGPPGARVDCVTVEFGNPGGMPASNSFDPLPTTR